MHLTVETVAIDAQRTIDGDLYPHVYECKTQGATIEIACNWIRAHRQELNARSDAVGTILLRGFPIATGQDFDAAVTAFDFPVFTYEESLSNAVRRNVTPKVFTANEAPSTFTILMHHEMAQTPIYPSKLFFFCEQAPESGGATPVCRSDELFRILSRRQPAFARDCEAKGLKYTHVMAGNDNLSSGMGRSWVNTFGTDSRAGAEMRMQKLGYTWEWLDDGSCRATTPVLQAVRNVGGRKTFFNQLVAFSRSLLEKRDDASHSIRYGDDTPFDVEPLAEVAAIAEECAVDLPWQNGDVALVDNYLTMHGRRPFTGDRRILASLIAS